MTLYFITRLPALMLAHAEHIIFSLSTSCSCILLFICASYVFFLQSFGDFINCTDFSGVNKAVGTFCFYNIRVPTSVDKSTWNKSDDNPFAKHDIFQWMPYVLFFQSLLFYLPKIFMKHLEGTNFSFGVPIFVKEEGLLSTEKNSVKMYKAYKSFLRTVEANDYFALGRILCEFFNVVVISLQIYLMKINLETKFYEDAYTENPFDRVFPKEIRCTQPKLGLNGTVEYTVAKCSLPINYINEGIYTYLWICTNLLLGLATLVLVYRAVSVVLYCRCNAFNRFEFSRLCWGPLRQDDLMVTSKWGFSRWLILRRLAGEMTGEDFGLLIDALRSQKLALPASDDEA